MDEWKIEKSTLAAVGAAFIIAFLFSFTSFWQLAVPAGMAAGYLSPSFRRGALAGSCGTASAWVLYMVVKNNWKLLDQVGGIIVGGRGHGIVMFLVIVLIAGILGALGGVIGRGIRAVIR